MRLYAPFVLASFIGLATVAGCGSSGPSRLSFTPKPIALRGDQTATSISNARKFLEIMMDLYAKDSTPRLVQSFSGGPLKGFTDAVTYDDALFVDAMLADGSAAHVARAKVIGNAFLYVQAHDRAGDGRVRAAYAPKPLHDPNDVTVKDNTSDVGNMAWVGQALLQVYAVTSDPAYLDGALAVAQWLQKNTYDTRGAGGYTGGFTADGRKIQWKSTEHNIDVSAFFAMLAVESGQDEWATYAARAEQFVASMWDGHDGRFFAGTGNDGVTPNRTFKPEDVNSWSYLAFANPAWAGAPTWDVANLSVSGGGFAGVSFCSGDRSGTWFEGTAHLADALELRDASGDRSQAQQYLNDIGYAQRNGPNGDGIGVIAASKSISDCDGGKYFSSLHVGATAWYIMAAGSINPFQLLSPALRNREEKNQFGPRL